MLPLLTQTVSPTELPFWFDHSFRRRTVVFCFLFSYVPLKTELSLSSIVLEGVEINLRECLILNMRIQMKACSLYIIHALATDRPYWDTYSFPSTEPLGQLVEGMLCMLTSVLELFQAFSSLDKYNKCSYLSPCSVIWRFLTRFSCIHKPHS